MKFFDKSEFFGRSPVWRARQDSNFNFHLTGLVPCGLRTLAALEHFLSSEKSRAMYTVMYTISRCIDRYIIESIELYVRSWRARQDSNL